MAFSTNLFKNARKLGVTPVVAARMEKEFDRMYADAREESLLVTLGLVYNALVQDFWTKTAKKKIFELHKSFLSLYDAYLCNTVTLEDLGAYIKEVTGDELGINHIKLNTDGKWEKVEGLFSHKTNYKVRYNAAMQMLKKAVAAMEQQSDEKKIPCEEFKRFLQKEEEIEKQLSRSFFGDIGSCKEK